MRIVASTRYLNVILLFCLGVIVVLALGSHEEKVTADGPSEVAFSITIIPNADRIMSGVTFEVLLAASNKSAEPVLDYGIVTYLTEGLALSNNREHHSLYEPVLMHSLNLLPGATEEIRLQLYVQEGANSWEGIAFVHQDEIIARHSIAIPDMDGKLPEPSTLQSDYQMPQPPDVTCVTVPAPLSDIGQAVMQALTTYYGGETYYSEPTQCNRFPGDWILDVPNVITETMPATAEAITFYQRTADMLRETEYVFDLATLHFQTHNQIGEDNLVQAYLAPAVRDLHIDTPETGPFPLLRFAYADADTFPRYDSEQEVLEDLTIRLKEVEPDSSKWRVSIAVATIGDIDLAQLQLSPWNHAKIAIQDYRHAIVGGMNWNLDYLYPINVNDDDERIGHPLYDLSMEVEGEAAKAAGVYFDRLWRRNIDPLFPHLGNDCETSWPISGLWAHDCPLDSVPAYAPAGNQIPDYSIDEAAHVFGLGRGHTEWLPVGDMDASADAAIMAALDRAQSSIYLSQHRLTSSITEMDFVEPLKEALIGAVLRGVMVRIALPEEWGLRLIDGEGPVEVYDALQRELHTSAVTYYAESPNPTFEIDSALCRLQVGTFHLPYHTYPETEDHVYYNHSKFFFVDEKAFYIGSQNLYPGGIGSSASDLIVDLNEYGFLVDDVALAEQIQWQYWDPVWEQTGDWANRNQPEKISPGRRCMDGILIGAELEGRAFLPRILWDTE